MSRIVLNPDHLSSVAALLEEAAGEYESIGTRVANCDCGCMPADVASVVDSVVANVRGSLALVSSRLAEQAHGLAWRAAIDQDGGGLGFSVGGGGWAGVGPEASASGSSMAVGGFGFDPSMASTGVVGAVFAGGYGFQPSMASSGVVGTMSAGGYGYDPSMESGAVVGGIWIGGEEPDPSPSYGPVGTTSVGGSDPSVFGTADGNGGFSLGGFGGPFDETTLGPGNALPFGGWYDPRMTDLSAEAAEVARLLNEAMNIPQTYPGPILPVWAGGYAAMSNVDLPYVDPYGVPYEPVGWNQLIG